VNHRILKIFCRKKFRIPASKAQLCGTGEECMKYWRKNKKSAEKEMMKHGRITQETGGRRKEENGMGQERKISIEMSLEFGQQRYGSFI
jgi:hypothetical protein